MTAEVAILNKQSVALAADSAVTTSDLKIFNTSKLFALSKSRPVGIMAYSSAEVMGVPVETVIKEFRRMRGPQSRQHLEEYAADFGEFLREDKSVFCEEGRMHSLSILACGLIQKLFGDTRSKLQNGWGHPTSGEARNALSDAIAEMERRVNEASEVQVAQPLKVRHLVCDAIENRLSETLTQLKGVLPVSARAEKRIRKVVVDCFFRDMAVDGETGFAIAGFGDSDIFPRLRSFEFHYSAFGLHKMRDYAKVDISVSDAGRIVPFGQKDVMATFVEGMEPSCKAMLLSFISRYFEEQKNMLMKEMPPRTSEAAAIEASGNELVKRLPEALSELAHNAFVWPMMHVVESMPKEELATLAEAFINLTTLKRKASTDLETVGGPTDVAVISKGDGFVWIKRKHYFDLKYNPTFAIPRSMENSDENPT